jgi:hypothetical protein
VKQVMHPNLKKKASRKFTVPIRAPVKILVWREALGKFVGAVFFHFGIRKNVFLEQKAK